MKKILFLILSFICIPTIAAAKIDPNYSVKAMYINADVLDNGNMIVKELIILKGDFNGYEREIYLSNGKLSHKDEINFEHDAIYNPEDINLIKTSAKKMKKFSFSDVNDEFDDFSETKSDAVGDSGVYKVDKNERELVVRTYKSCKGCQVGFYYEYEVSKAVVMHNDIAELYYEFIGDGFTDDIKNVEIRVNLPGVDKSENFKVWAHGNLQGEIYPNSDNNGVVAKVEKLKKKNTVDIRMTFDKSLMDSSYDFKTSNEDALSSIVEIENKRAEEADKERARIRRIYYSIVYSSLIYIVLLIIYFIYIAIRYDKEYKTDFDHEYNREFIEDYDVEVIDYLMNKSITPNAMSASVMNLIYKKKIKATEVDKKDYSFELVSREGLSSSEEKLVKFLFDDIGNGQTFTLKQLKKYASSSKTCDKFNASYASWKNKVTVLGEKEKFYEDLTLVRTKGILYGALGIAIFIISVINIEDFAISHLVIIPAVLFIIYVAAFRKKTLKGINHYKRWMAFKNFLNDFGDFEEKELPEVALWERYLVYAVIFGLASKVQKAMNVKITQMESAGVYNPMFDPLYFHMNLNLSHTINSSVSSAVNSAVSSAVARSASSSTGGGGGFSSGGGFGGGGGGGHGF